MHTFTVKDKKHIRSTAHLVKECSYDKKGQVRSYGVMILTWYGLVIYGRTHIGLAGHSTKYLFLVYSFALLVKTECKKEL